jgi:hypothetical protein
VQSGLEGISAAGLAAKAAVLAVFYGLERMSAAAGKRGMELQQFAAATGLSAEMLQKWQYAAMQFGVGGEEVESTAKSIQNAMTNMRLGLGAPQGFQEFSRAVQLDESRLNDVFYIMKKLQEFAKQGDPAITKRLVESLGLGDKMFQFLRLNKVDVEKIKPSNIISDREIAHLAKVDAAWANLWYRLKLISAHQVSKYGLFAVDELSSALSQILKLTDAFIKLGKEYPALRNISIVLAGIAALNFAPLTTLVSGLVLLLADSNKATKDKRGPLLEQLYQDNKGFFDWIGKAAGAGGFGAENGTIAPKISPQSAPSNNSTEIKIEQTFQHDGSNASELKDATQSGLFSAYRSIQAQTQIA